jgi:hypothetical protein
VYFVNKFLPQYFDEYFLVDEPSQDILLLLALKNAKHTD